VNRQQNLFIYYMAYNQKLAGRIKQALAHLPVVEEKEMFGGIAFMVNGKMCITVGKDRIMCRIDPALRDDVTRDKGAMPMKMGGREYKGYVHINEEVIKTKKEMDYWIGLALDFNKTAKASKKKNA
jgi:TfoX/Sxy family transcriptional regulator of competence genes